MKLEEAIKYLDMMENKINFDLEGYTYGNEAIDTVLEVLKNSIPINKIEDKINELKQNQKLEKEGIFNRENVECIEENGKIKILQELLKGDK